MGMVFQVVVYAIKAEQRLVGAAFADLGGAPLGNQIDVRDDSPACPRTLFVSSSASQALRLARDAARRIDLGGEAGRAGLGTPSWGGDHAGFHQLKGVEEASDPSRAAQVVGRVGGLVPDTRGLHHLLAGVGAVI